MKKQRVRNRILHRASRLFFASGFNATGIDTVTAGCQVAKMNVYRHFPSKDELIRQVILASKAATEEALNLILESAQLNAREKLHLGFCALYQSLHDREAMGALVSRALPEFPEPEHPIHKAALAVKGWMLVKLEAMAGASGFSEPDRVAEELFFIAEGCFGAAPVLGVKQGRQLAHRLATALLFSRQAPPLARPAENPERNF